MSHGERLVMLGCGILAVALLMCTAVITGGMLLAGTGGSALFDSLADGRSSVREPVRFDSAPQTGTAGAPAAARPLTGDSAADIDAARAERAAAASPLGALPLPAPARGEAGDLTTLFEQVNPGVVSIEVPQMINGIVVGGGQGSGFLIDDRHVVTNNHVVTNKREVDIVFDSGLRRTGEVVGTDVFSDLAVVRIDNLPSGVRPLPLLQDFDVLRVGEPVVAIGNPFGHANTMTSGIISALGRTIPDGATRFAIPQTIQTDAAINPGNSGGPLLNARGQVIGVNAQIQTQGTAANAGVGFAIPASIVAKVVPELIRSGAYRWPYLGVQGGALNSEITIARGLDLDMQGAYIGEVLLDGPSRGRLQGTTGSSQNSLQGGPVSPDGDIVIAIDGEPVFSFDDLLTYVSLETKPGDTIEMTVLRGDERIAVPVTLGERSLDEPIRR